MNINRYNYEEFFLLYVDNELTKAERLEVEAFVDANTDLREELNILNELKLKPDTGIRFEAKELLMKPEAEGGIINPTNYEEFFLLYVDDELTAIERREVEKFAAINPAMQQELNLLLQTKVEPEHAIVFPDKSLLYKQPETDRKPVVFMWKRVVAVAAMLLVALGIFWIANRQPAKEVAVVDKGQQQINGQTIKEQKQEIAKEENNQPSNDQQVQQPVITPDNAQDQQLANTNKEEKRSTNPVNKPRRFDTRDNDKPQFAVHDNNKQNQDAVIDSDRPLTNTGIASVTNNPTGTVISTRVESAHLTPAAQAKGEIVSYASNVEDNYSEEAFGPVGVKKNKLRGLFRKVTRVFEKTTNLPGIEERGILIGNFEIALK
jgi:type II secretory pathway pseudopilin PulG